MDDLIERFIAYLLDVGLINSQKAKGELFILRRRYTMMQNQATAKGREFDKDEDSLYEFFEE
jgi:hypothetical protein